MIINVAGACACVRVYVRICGGIIRRVRHTLPRLLLQAKVVYAGWRLSAWGLRTLRPGPTSRFNYCQLIACIH
jgi:hypothetical protein